MRVEIPTPWRAVAFAVAAGAGALLALGVPTAVIPNGFFRRMTPTRPQDYLFLGLAVALAAALGASYAIPATCPWQQREMTAGGLLTFFAIGCPICNKLVVLLLGISGAFTYFEPIQPLLGGVAVLSLGFALWVRLRAVRSAVAYGARQA